MRVRNACGVTLRPSMKAPRDFVVDRDVGSAHCSGWRQMTRTRLWVGLDVGADEMTVCCTDDQGNVVFEQLVPTKAVALHALLKGAKRRIALIGLEAGSFGVPLTRSLRKLGYRVAVFDTR